MAARLAPRGRTATAVGRARLAGCPGRLRALELVGVRGRSMLPTLAEGDVLLVRGGRAAHRRARAGRLAVVRLSADRPVAVKRLAVRDDDGWWVERDNPAEGVDSWQLGTRCRTPTSSGSSCAGCGRPPFRLGGPRSAGRRVGE